MQQRSEVKYRSEAMFTLHQINAFEDNGFLVMDMCCGDNGEVIGDFTLENLRRESGEEMDKVAHTHAYIHTHIHEFCSEVFFIFFIFIRYFRPRVHSETYTDTTANR